MLKSSEEALARLTVSWCKFYYSSNSLHNLVNLVGHSQNNVAEDTGKLHVTYHHNLPPK